MKTILAAALAALLLAGCASLGASGGADEQALLIECRAKADAQYKARYTSKWEAAVQACMKKKTAP